MAKNKDAIIEKPSELVTAVEKKFRNVGRAKSDKVKTKTNFDNTYADIIFPYVFSKQYGKAGGAVGPAQANKGTLEDAVRYTTIKVPVRTVKGGGIDSTGGFKVSASGTVIGENTGFGPVKPVKVYFKTVLVDRKTVTKKASSAKTYKKAWVTFSIPKNATALDVIQWITKNWKKQPQQLQIGNKVYNITPKKKAYNNPSRAESAGTGGVNNPFPPK